MKYEERIILYLDILNFKSLIDRSSDDQRIIPDIFDLYSDISEAFNLNNEHWETTSTKKTTQFSDTVIISYEITEIEYVVDALIDIQVLIAKFISKKQLVRGVVVKGLLYHKDDLIFGPGLVKAYLMESKAAIYPRVIIEEDIIKDAKKISKNMNKNSPVDYYPGGNINFTLDILLDKDHDDFYFINYFLNIGYYFSPESELENTFYNFIGYMDTLHDVIKKGLLEKEVSVKIKYSWMKNYYNKAVDELKKPDFFKNANKKMDNEAYIELIDDLKGLRKL